MNNDNKSFNKFLQTLSEEQKKLASAKIDVAFKRIFDEGALPFEAMDVPEEVMEFVYSEAYRYYKNGLFEKAQEFFELLVLLNPLEPKYILGQAACLQMRKEYLMAVVVYDILSQAMPNSPLPHFYIYECAMQLNAYDDARKALEKVIELSELDSRSFSQMSDKAKVMLEGLLALHPQVGGELNESLIEKTL